MNIPGRVETAQYREQELPIYQGNPWIEALPELEDQAQLMRALLAVPNWSASDCERPAHLREHLVNASSDLFVPLPHVVHLAHGVAAMIRKGYVHRNLAKAPDSAIHQRVEAALNGVTYLGLAQSASIVGASGIGKTAALSAILRRYPQVIHHEYYRGVPIAVSQIVWLALETPRDGSIRALCLQFILRVDELLGTRYFETYGGRRATTDDAMLGMAIVASIHRIGLLVVEEIQHLRPRSKKSRPTPISDIGAEEMMRFLTNLINGLSIPVLVTGTYGALPILTDQFRAARRVVSPISAIWDPLPEGREWDVFTRALFKYQYLRNPAPLSSELVSVLHYESIGIPDLAVKLFQAAQLTALRERGETLDVPLLRRTAAHLFRLVQHILSAYRRGEFSALAALEDIAPIQVSAAAEELAQDEPPSEPTAVSQDEPPSEVTLPQDERKRPVSVEGLLGILKISVKQKTSPHAVLGEQGYLRPASEFIAIP